MSHPRSPRVAEPVGPGWENKTDGTGRTPTSDPLLDRINLVYEGSGPVSILPEADSTADHPTEIERMSRVDGCPVCVDNYVLPRITRPEGAGFRAYYSCSDCGHDWITNWGS